MRPGVGADGVTGCGDLPEKFRMIHRVLADREEHRLGALVGERLEHRGRIDGPRTVIEGQHDFLVRKEIELLEMLEAETRPASGVDFDHARDAERVGIGASLIRLRERGGRRSFGNAAGDLHRIMAGGCWFCGSSGSEGCVRVGNLLWRG